MVLSLASMIPNFDSAIGESLNTFIRLPITLPQGIPTVFQLATHFHTTTVRVNDLNNRCAVSLQNRLSIHDVSFWSWILFCQGWGAFVGWADFYLLSLELNLSLTQNCGCCLFPMYKHQLPPKDLCRAIWTTPSTFLVSSKSLYL